MKNWFRLTMESESIGLLATKFLALLGNAWREDGTLPDVEVHYRRVGDTTVEYVLSPTAALLVRRGGTLQDFRSRLIKLDAKPDLADYRRMHL